MTQIPHDTSPHRALLISPAHTSLLPPPVLSLHRWIRCCLARGIGRGVGQGSDPVLGQDRAWLCDVQREGGYDDHPVRLQKEMSDFSSLEPFQRRTKPIFEGGGGGKKHPPSPKKRGFAGKKTPF